VGEHGVTALIPDEVRIRALMVSYQSGDLGAFEQLYALLAPAVRRFLRRHASDAALVDDLVQETFLQIHRARRSYDARYSPMPWVIAISHHVWLMHCRSTRRRPKATADVESVLLSVRGYAEAYADRADVRAAVAALPRERRQPVVWHHVLGLSFRDIAERLGIREGAAKLRSSRGIAELRQRLAAPRTGGKKDTNE
jgi:RNA polymerase sigma-70 factor (ECF subfamily)